MMPHSGFSLLVHALILLIRFLGRTLGLSVNKFKEKALRLGLKVSPRLSAKVLSPDFFLRQVFAYSIIAAIFTLVMAGAVFSFRVSLRNGGNYSIVSSLFKGTQAMAGQTMKSDNLIEVDSSTTQDTTVDLENISGPNQTPGDNSWLTATLQSIDNYQISNYHTKSDSNSAIGKKLLLDKN